ncbi:sialate O-acetylesterase [Mesonia sp. MT50]|uniref:Sialate O-acetylesterase n=1 Tax=Mesonia profundi TaxID=3070998 RepID=A0ABU0ZYU4_9FLAO|nr:sialate O-acetylesterase [Mesonia profundi]MDQ7916544.1 sialate O-acetylesterase [Mesonia profundi]
MNRHIKYLGCLLIVLLSSCHKNTEDTVIQEDQKVFLVAGQSNAMGVGDREKSIKQENIEVVEYNSQYDVIQLLNDPIGQNHLGFQQAQTGSFLAALGYEYNKLTKNKVIVVQAAKGGASLTKEAEIENWGNWSSSGSLFQNSLTKIKMMQACFLQGEIPKASIDAIFWSQGENEGQAIANQIIEKQDYKNALIQLVEKYLSHLGEVPFIIIETGRFQGDSIKDQGYKAVREAQREVAAEMENVHIGYDETELFIERHWLKDVVHYNQEALNDIGEKLAYFYVSLEE